VYTLYELQVPFKIQIQDTETSAGLIGLLQVAGRELVARGRWSSLAAVNTGG
jgi:hypothetical protein